MKNVSHLLPICLLLLFCVQCTSTRWTVKDLQAVDSRETPEVLSTSYKVLAEETISVSRPFLHLNLYRIDELEVPERVLVERTVQSYQPKWGFALLGSLGASIAFYAANSDGLVENFSKKQSLAMNTTGVLLTAIAITNMKPSGDPIPTGEIKYLRRSGSHIERDTTRFSGGLQLNVDVEISYRNQTLLDETYRYFDENGMRISLPGLLTNQVVRGTDPGEFEVRITQGSDETRFRVPVSDVMRPVVVVTSPVAELRHEPVYDVQSTFTEVGRGSELIYSGQPAARWYEVQLGGSNLFIARELGEIQWKEAEIARDPRIVSIDEVPFGELDVEYSIPVLTDPRGRDAALFFSNHEQNQLGVRRYLDRDLQLMDLYFNEALGVNRNRIVYQKMSPDTPSGLRLNGSRNGHSLLPENIRLDSTSTFYAYISGFARIGEGGSIELVQLSEENTTTVVNLEELLTDLASHNSDRLVIFLDLEFDSPSQYQGMAGNGSFAYRLLADRVLDHNENSALIFSSRPDQVPGLYESVRDIRYHHLFPYFIAQALQQRKTKLLDLIRHVENQVDYTSRRLHDRPQTIQSYGNLTMDLIETTDEPAAGPS